MAVPTTASPGTGPGSPRGRLPLEAGDSAGLTARLERWESWFTALPLAGYLVLHLVTRALAFGAGEFEGGLRAFEARHPLLLAVQFTLIAGAFAAHASVGFWRMLRQPARPELAGMPRASRELSYGSALVLFAFIVFHVWQFEGRLWLGEIDRTDFPSELIASLSSTTAGGIPLCALGYCVALAAAAVHLGLAAYRAGLRSGLARSRRAPWFGRACVGVALLFFLGGTLLVIDVATGSLALTSVRLGALGR
ncbi:MAG TPA: hypothetical protein VG963_21580 [Polyangiaceae bacterium]|nr:hypothetical protein [Polyangiaceae bacterium]